MKLRKIIDEEQLEYFYNKKKLSQDKVAEILHCSRRVVRSNLEYYDIHTRNPSEARELTSNWNKGLTKETDKRIANYAKRISKSRKGKEPWNKGIIHNNNILIKLLQEQPSINCDWDLTAFGYSKRILSRNGTITWVFRKYENARIQRLRKANSEKVKEYRKEYYQLHKEKLKKKVLDYQKTPKGKLTTIKSTNTHLGKGFISLNENLKITSDWHHIHKDLPFVISVDRKIHRANLGKKHYDLANSTMGWNIFVDKNSEITSLEYVESIIELNYPEQFKIYWFGNY